MEESKMKRSPDFPGLDSVNSDSTYHYEFDPPADFAQFLEEARRYADKKEVPKGESAKKEEFNQEKKQIKKKSWKLTALFSLWKTPEKNSKQCKTKLGSNIHSHSRDPRHPGHVSGPIICTGHGATVVSSKQHRRPVSGPLTNLFNSKKREEISEIPYVSLDKLNKPQYDAKVYGPIYLVS